MKIHLTDDQCKSCLIAVRCLLACNAALLYKDKRGYPNQEKAQTLLREIGPHGFNLRDGELSDDLAKTLKCALTVTHSMYMFSPLLRQHVQEGERQSVLKNIRDCLAKL